MHIKRLSNKFQFIGQTIKLNTDPQGDYFKTEVAALFLRLRAERSDHDEEENAADHRRM